MLQLLLQMLPSDVSGVALAIALAGAGVGGVLWLRGARFSRTLVGLVGVALGAVAGMLLPREMGWGISGAGPAVALSLAGGTLGYTLHRLWIGLGLGAALCGWGMLATWVILEGPTAFSWPPLAPGASVLEDVIQIWRALPHEVAQVLPVVCGGAIMIGLAMTVLSPVWAIATAWSAAGASLLAGLGVAAMQVSRPQWVSLLPRQLSGQLMALAVLVVVGTIAQWKTAQEAAGMAVGGPAVAGAGKPAGGNAAGGGKGKPLPRPVCEGAD
jgi:hypothetical protein